MPINENNAVTKPHIIFDTPTAIVVEKIAVV